MTDEDFSDLLLNLDQKNIQDMLGYWRSKLKAHLGNLTKDQTRTLIKTLYVSGTKELMIANFLSLSIYAVKQQLYKLDIKKCSKCKKIKGVASFGSHEGGLHSHCSDCVNGRSLKDHFNDRRWLSWMSKYYPSYCDFNGVSIVRFMKNEYSKLTVSQARNTKFLFAIHASKMDKNSRYSLVSDLYYLGFNHNTIRGILDCTSKDIIDILKLLNIKKCSRCGEMKGRESFFNQATTLDHLSTICTVCCRVVDLEQERNNPKLRFRRNVNSSIRSSLKRYHNCESSNFGFKLFDYSVQELSEYLEAQFNMHDDHPIHGKMSWDNSGKWHLDHIRPVSSFDITGPESEGFTECWAMDNLRPLWAEENMSKSDRYDPTEVAEIKEQIAMHLATLNGN